MVWMMIIKKFFTKVVLFLILSFRFKIFLEVIKADHFNFFFNISVFFKSWCNINSLLSFTKIIDIFINVIRIIFFLVVGILVNIIDLITINQFLLGSSSHLSHSFLVIFFWLVFLLFWFNWSNDTLNFYFLNLFIEVRVSDALLLDGLFNRTIFNILFTFILKQVDLWAFIACSNYLVVSLLTLSDLNSIVFFNWLLRSLSFRSLRVRACRFLNYIFGWTLSSNRFIVFILSLIGNLRLSNTISFHNW